MKTTEKGNILTFARNIYLIIAVGYVGYSFVGTIKKMLDNRIVVSVTENEFPRFTFPSITLCYPFKENFGKSVKNVIQQFQNEQGNELQWITVKIEMYWKSKISKKI